jgi:hypothetical protein
MTVLALDLGTKTGWATRVGGVVASGVCDLKGSRYEGGGMRFLRFRRWLDDVAAEATEIVFEEVRAHKGTDAAHVYGGLLAMLTAWCEEYRVPYRGVPVGEIKKHATGKGNAKKGAMMAAATARGWSFADDNEADALWILDLADGGAR